MRTLVHLSDIHFGRVDYSLISPLMEAVRRSRPDLVAVSGDLTQRARTHEFQAARAFLDSLPTPQIVVPGNHDVPLHNVWTRFASPLGKYRRYISRDLEPFYQDQEIAVLGINTARSLTIKGGRINGQQAALMRQRLCSVGAGVIKVVVTHHPIDLPEGYGEMDLVGRARLALDALADCAPDLFLAGHFHIGQAGHAVRREAVGRPALFVQAGTATSTRGRGQANSFNILRLDGDDLTIERHDWVPEQADFVASRLERFRRSPGGWSPANSPAV